MPVIDVEPIIVVLPEKRDYKERTTVPRDPDPLCEVTPELRDEFRSQVSSVARTFQRSFHSSPNVPAVAKVKLKDAAIVKSYKPTTLFDHRTCPIIGANTAGEVYVSASPTGLAKLDDRIKTSEAKRVRTNISALESITPYSSQDANQMPHEAVRDAEIRVRLFRHDSSTINKRIDDAFEALAAECGADDIADIPYSDSMKVFQVRGADENVVATLSSFVGTQSVSHMPDYHLVKTTAQIIGNITSKNFPPPKSGQMYGVVGVIDSGSDPANKHMQAWIVDRHSLVPVSQQDNNHGTFVCGLVANPRKLNHGNTGFPADQAKIVDIVAIDKTGSIKESQLLFAIDDAIRRYPQVKVWNLSLALSRPVSDTSMSLLGVSLDERRKRHGVLFVTPTGNVPQNVPMRSWPVTGEVAEDDRMSPPGDGHSVMTVGGLAHTETASSVVKRDEPSPFVCRGLGFGGQLKPEIVCYAGNSDKDGGSSQMGILSVDAAGNVAENIGVSFAVPQVSAVSANVHQQLATEPANPTLVKGLVTHAGFLRCAPLKAENIEYTGVGRLLSSHQIINCSQSAATVICDPPELSQTPLSLALQTWHHQRSTSQVDLRRLDVSFCLSV